ncbi:MAG: hypothetical protein AAFV86_13655 [Pseudomonadota bacterium]
MPIIRFSAVPKTRDNDTPWVLYGETAEARLAAGVKDAQPLATAKISGSGTRNIAVKAKSKKAMAHYLKPILEAWDGEGPIVIFVHGFQFDSRVAGDKPGASVNPHVQLYHALEHKGGPGGKAEQDSHASPWLARMAGGEPATGEDWDFPGLAICFGYESWGNELEDNAQPSTLDLLRAFIDIELSGGRLRNVYAQAYLDSQVAGHVLAHVVEGLHAALEGHPGAHREIDVFAHSLGTRTALKAIECVAADHVEPNADAPETDSMGRAIRHTALDRLGRVILVAGAAHQSQAMTALVSILKARLGQPDRERVPSFYNFNSSADDVIAFLGARAALIVQAGESGRQVGFLRALWRFIKGGEMIGREGGPDWRDFPDAVRGYPEWVDVQLDNALVQEWGRSIGVELKGARDEIGISKIGDHWIHYTHPQNWLLYRRIIRRERRTDVQSIKAGLDLIAGSAG